VELSTRSAGERQAVEALIAGLEVVYPDAGFAPTYGRLLAPLQRAGRLISTMDLLIATAAVQDGAPIVTANPAHFERISELDVVTY
jgi:predicted nucleic acid-binding protein